MTSDNKNEDYDVEVLTPQERLAQLIEDIKKNGEQNDQ